MTEIELLSDISGHLEKVRMLLGVICIQIGFGLLFLLKKK